MVFADVAQPDQARIVAINAHHFLKNQGHFVISIKASSQSYTVYWGSSAEEKVCEFCESGNILECFLALFNFSWNFYI